MDLFDLVARTAIPIPWAEGDNIPWDEPGFSARMLEEHLSQAHDKASRRFEIIDRQIERIHHEVLGQRPSRVLDLACGPGFYTNRLAKLGHSCVGIDYSPAAIVYAAEEAELEDLECCYVLDDIRKAKYGGNYNLAMLLFGEFNVFRPEDARLLLCKAHKALLEGGVLLLEPHTFAALRRIGSRSPEWFTNSSGLFSEEPHLCLVENSWDSAQHTATVRYFVIDAATAEVSRFAHTFQAYTEADYRDVLEDCGFTDVIFYPSLGGEEEDPPGDLIVVQCRKAPAEGGKGCRATLSIDGEALIDM